MRVSPEDLEIFLKCPARFALSRNLPPHHVENSMEERLVVAARKVLARSHEPNFDESTLRAIWSEVLADWIPDTGQVPKWLREEIARGLERLRWLYHELHRFPYRVLASDIYHTISFQGHEIVVHLDLVREIPQGPELCAVRFMGEMSRFIVDRHYTIGLIAWAAEEVLKVRRLPIRVFDIGRAGSVYLTVRDGHDRQHLEGLLRRILPAMQQIAWPHFAAHCKTCPVIAACKRREYRPLIKEAAR